MSNLTIIVLSLIAVLAMYAYMSYEISKRDQRIARLESKLENKSTRIAEWQFAYGELELDYNAIYTELITLQAKYGVAITDYKISNGVIKAHKVGTIGNNGSTRNAYAMELPLMPAMPKDYNIALDDKGLFSAVKVEKTESKPKATNGNSSKSKANEAPKVDSKSSEDNSSKDSTPFESPKFAIVNTKVCKELGVDSLSKDHHKWLSDKVTKWSANPNTTTDNMVTWAVKYFKSQNGK